MKAEAVISLIFLLLAAVSHPAASSAPSPPPNDTVLDLNRQALRTGTGYYILPVIRGRGGGLTMGHPRNGTCPLDVVQEQLEVSSGLPATFSPATGKKGAVRLSADVNIKFSAASTCVQSTVWRLGPHDDETGQWFVSTAGKAGDPGPGTISNWFKIEALGSDYKLVFCPTVCNFCKVLCRDVGVYIDAGGKRRLALSDVPFRVMFKKA